jgi:hypothetical protein
LHKHSDNQERLPKRMYATGPARLMSRLHSTESIAFTYLFMNI